MRKPTSRSRGGPCVFCVWTEPIAATSYGDDHHHCSAVTVLLRLIGNEVVLVETAPVNPASPVIGFETRHKRRVSNPITGE